MPSFRIALLAAVALVPFQPVLAQDEPAPDEDARPTDDFHGEIVVTAPGLRRLDVLAGTSVIEGTELQRNQAGQLGEVLAKLPGVSATSFSPGASRPVLRGFSGERVKVLTDGIGSIDASSTSADHAVTIDPLLADRIEVLRGPAVLLYGSQAIGGAVNVIGKRIPPRVPDEPMHLDALAAFDTADGGLALHIDGSWRKTGDLAIPGYVASDALRAELLAGADRLEADGFDDKAADTRATADLKDTLPNS
ncbi:MAG: TonB-dependent receptor, partial [Proteobacteria bacterium]|nr:TonB-dependent receptor [Pseudomonadota bacterium]